MNLKKKSSKKSGKKISIADKAFEKTLEMKHKKLQQEIQNQELGYYLKLREKKIAYVRHM